MRRKKKGITFLDKCDDFYAEAGVTIKEARKAIYDLFNERRGIAGMGKSATVKLPIEVDVNQWAKWAAEAQREAITSSFAAAKPVSLDQSMWDGLTFNQKVDVAMHESLHTLYADMYLNPALRQHDQNGDREGICTAYERACGRHSRCPRNVLSNVGVTVTKAEPTMGKLIRHFTAREMAVICWVVNQREKTTDLYAGALPFVPVNKVLIALTTYNPMNRTVKSILQKLNLACGRNEPVLQLRTSKVAAYFGPHPERGKVIPWLGVKKVKVGVRWSLPKRDYVPDDNVNVRPSVALRLWCAGNDGLDHYRVSAPPRHWPAIEQWLIDKFR